MQNPLGYYCPCSQVRIFESFSSAFFIKRFDNFKIFVYKRINHISNMHFFEIASIARVNARSVLIAWI
nr:hypothetical protein [Escherichia coli]